MRRCRRARSSAPLAPIRSRPLAIGEARMTYDMAPLACNPSAVKGLSERLLRSHYENNYGGAVKRLNAITAELAALDVAAAPVFTINGLKREELIAANSMILHE